ncbi:MAG: phosphotransferase [Phycisphaerales bacterium]|nr:phosphotransferase [Phycisphaerales bacterium]
MDDQTAYALNALVQRHYNVGRIVRFRPVQRGRQCESYELLTAGGQEYTLQVYLPEFTQELLDRTAAVLELISQDGFPVGHPVGLKQKDAAIACVGPQNRLMLLLDMLHGQSLPVEQWSEQDLSQLGVRLAWMHRSLAHVPFPPINLGCGNRLRVAAAAHEARATRIAAALGTETFEQLAALKPPGEPVLGHGSLDPAAIMLDGDRLITAITDWGAVGLGTTESDIVDALVLWCVQADGTGIYPRAKAFCEAYFSLANSKAFDWGQAVRQWCVHRGAEAVAGRRPLPRGFADIAREPQSLADMLAGVHLD